jgi:hypothetical protein
MLLGLICDFFRNWTSVIGRSDLESCILSLVSISIFVLKENQSMIEHLERY